MGKYSLPLRINVVYATNETWERYDLVCELGRQKKLLLQQCIDAYFGDPDRKAFYSRCVTKEHTARGLSEQDYIAEIVSGKKDSQLTPYKTVVVDFGVSRISPIGDIPSGAENTRAFNIVDLSVMNFVLLRVARIVDGGSMAQVVSKILHAHFEDYWPRYYEQIRSAELGLINLPAEEL